MKIGFTIKELEQPQFKKIVLALAEHFKNENAQVSHINEKIIIEPKEKPKKL